MTPDRTLDLALQAVTTTAINAARAGAASDQIEAAARRGLLIARTPHDTDPRPDEQSP